MVFKFLNSENTNNKWAIKDKIPKFVMDTNLKYYGINSPF